MNEYKIKKLNPVQLKEKISELNQQLKSFGWKDGISTLLLGCKTHGFLYEYKQKNGLILPTAMNCFAVIAHKNPDLIVKLIHNHEFEAFLKCISQIGMCLEVATTIFNLKYEPDEIQHFPEGWK